MRGHLLEHLHHFVHLVCQIIDLTFQALILFNKIFHDLMDSIKLIRANFVELFLSFFIGKVEVFDELFDFLVVVGILNAGVDEALALKLVKLRVQLLDFALQFF